MKLSKQSAEGQPFNQHISAGKKKLHFTIIKARGIFSKIILDSFQYIIEYKTLQKAYNALQDRF